MKSRFKKNRETHLVSLVNHLLGQIPVPEMARPNELSKLAYQLFRRHTFDVRLLKTGDKDSQNSALAKQLQRDLTAGVNSMNGTDAKTVLETANRCFGMTDIRLNDRIDVSTHFQLSSSLADKGRLLHEVARIVQPEHMLEIGTAYGMSALFLMKAARKANENARLQTIEISEPQYSIASDMLTREFGNAVTCHYGNANQSIADLISDSRDCFDLVFYDGPHDGESYRQDFNRLLPSMKSGSVFVLDDINWFDRRFAKHNPHCYKGWQSIARHPRVDCALEIDKTIGIAILGV